MGQRADLVVQIGRLRCGGFTPTYYCAEQELPGEMTKFVVSRDWFRVELYYDTEWWVLFSSCSLESSVGGWLTVQKCHLTGIAKLDCHQERHHQMVVLS